VIYKYQVRPGGHVNGDPEKVADELQKLAKNKKDGFQAEDVLQAAQPAGSPLHGEFEWDERTAAHEFRLHQARTLAGAFILVEVRDGEEVETGPRAFVFAEGAYRSIQNVAVSEPQSAEVLQQYLDEAQSWRERYERVRKYLKPRDRRIVQPILKGIDTALQMHEQRVGAG
jgi:hypothetical protein